MKVIEYLRKRVRKGTLHMTLIDPAKQEPEQAGEIAASADRFGTDAIMVGGSTGITQENLDATILAIKKSISKYAVFFPCSACCMCFAAGLRWAMQNRPPDGTRLEPYVGSSIGCHCSFQLILFSLLSGQETWEEASCLVVPLE